MRSLFKPQGLCRFADRYKVGRSYDHEICDEESSGIYEQEIEPMKLDGYGIYVVGFGIKAYYVGIVLDGCKDKCGDVAYDYALYYHSESEVDEYPAY